MHDLEDSAAGTLVITVRGAAGPSVRKSFSDVDVLVEGDMTKFRTPNADQSAMHGLLQRMENLGLEVLEVHLEPTQS